MTVRLWIYVVITGLLVFGLSLSCAYHRGLTNGAITQKIATDNQRLQVAKQATSEATVNQEKFDARVTQTHEKTETARKALVPFRERVAITPSGVSVNGDTTAETVIPALVNIIHYQDTLQIRSDSEIHAQQFRHVADTVTIGAAKYEAKAAEELARDFGKQKNPRCGRTCGILIGSVGTLAVVATFVHFVK